MAGNFKVHAFGVSRFNEETPLLIDTLANIERDGINSRVRTIGQSDIRVEHIERRNGIWLMDFVKFRDVHGPGKGSHTTAVTGFDFDENEVFCEETAALFDPSTSHLIIQYNHHGVRYGAIQEYFSYYDLHARNSYSLNPKFDSSVEDRFQRRHSIKKLTLSIDPRLLTQEDRDQNTALFNAAGIGDASNAGSVEIIISAGRARNRSLTEFIDRTIDKLKNINQTNPDAVNKLEVAVAPDLDSKVQVLDLLEQRLVQDFSDVPLGPDHRWPRDARYNTLQRAHAGWLRIFRQ